MRLLDDYECQGCLTVFEELADPTTPEKVKCPGCCQFGLAARLIGSPRLDPTLGIDAEGFPTLGKKWESRRRKHQQIEERRYREHGD